jgi:putative ABC transport system permease protein
VDGVETVSNIRQDIAQVDGDGANLTGLDDRVSQVYDFRWEEGSDDVLANLGADGALLPNNVAEDRNLGVGDSITVRSTGGEMKDFVVRGIYEGSPFYPLLGSASVSQAAFDELYDRPRNRFTLLNVADSAAAKPAVESALEGFPDTRIQTRAEWIDKEDQEIQQFLLLLYVLLALSVIVSLFGMVNTLALSVFERTRELGMLRAVGMTRRQTRRMIRHESVITALIGAALGLPLGIFLAALVTSALGQYDLRFELPLGQLIVLVVVAVFAGLLAAITPARRAAKLDPLKALQYE